MATVVPPTKVPQPDGTIQLVPVPPAIVYTPYFIDPTMQYQLYMKTDWANKTWDGKTKNGRIALKGEIVTAEVMAMPFAKTKVVDGKNVNMFSIYRSSDVVIQYDHTRLELLPIDSTQPIGFDPNVMDASKTNYTILGDGLILYHAEALKAPEMRNPALPPKYYQWNFDGYMWQSAYRMLGRLQFRVKDDYHLPAWGQQKSFIRLLPSTIVSGTEYKTKVDGSPTVGTNILKEVRSEGEDIIFGVSPEHKVSHYLSAPTANFGVGDTVKVQLRMKPEGKPQLVQALATNFVWDPNVLEFMGADKTGGLTGMENGISRPGAGSINETTVPKDGNAWHNWLNPLGSKKYLETDSLICTFNFVVLADFDTTQIDIVKNTDPRLATAGLVPEDSRPLGSSIPGAPILGQQYGVTINGSLIG